MRKWIHRPHVEGKASRQAHADLPKGTYEREISKEGFFGPSAHLYHPNPPTGWSGNSSRPSVRSASSHAQLGWVMPALT